jgi:hypothetical protein
MPAGLYLDSTTQSMMSILQSMNEIFRLKRVGPTRAPLQSDHDRFRLGIVFENFVPHFAAPAGLFVTAERQR